MAKIKINKIRLSSGMSDTQRIYELEKNLYSLECELEHILTNLSDENMNVSRSGEAEK